MVMPTPFADAAPSGQAIAGRRDPRPKALNPQLTSAGMVVLTPLPIDLSAPERLKPLAARSG
jgi:hypothetical protein